MPWRLQGLLAALLVTSGLVALPCRAEPKPDAPTQGTAGAAAGAPAQPGADGAPQEEEYPWQAGPRQVELGHDLVLDLSDRYAYLDKASSAKLLEKNGSTYTDNVLGLVIGTQPDEDWLVVIRYDDEGYIKDDEKVDADELISSLREGQKEANEERKKRGFEELSIDGWQEAPHYDRSVHHLIWGLNVGSPTGPSVNYNTRILGRKGVVSLNLVTDPAKLDAAKPLAAALLTKTTFKPGARYEDFQEGKDKVAEYGLGGLVLAGAGLSAAKLIKIGLLAKFWKLILAALIAGKKVIIVAAVAALAWLKRFFGGRSTPSTAAPTSPTPPAAAPPVVPLAQSGSEANASSASDPEA